MTEAAGDKNALRSAHFMPGFVKVCRGGLGRRCFEVGGVDPDEVQFSRAGHGSVFEGFDDGKVRVVQIGVFADKRDRDCLVEVILTVCEHFPGVPCLGALFGEGGGDGEGI